MSKLFLFAAPSGAGKTTIVRHLLEEFDELAFSVSATTRPKRPHEEDGKDYYFLTEGRFRALIEEDAFVEWEEVYQGLLYGTLRSEVNRLWKAGKHILFDIDVKGALNIKRKFPKETVAVFIKPPSIAALYDRLNKRKTENEASLKKRMDRAAEEMSYEPDFDLVLVNDDLKSALQEAERIILSSLQKED